MANRLDDSGLLYLWHRLKTLLGTFSVSTGTISSLPKEISDSRIDESTVVLNEWLFNDVEIGWVTVSGKLILYGDLPSGTTKPSSRLRLARVAGESNPAPACVISAEANGDIKAAYTNLIPGTQYSFILTLDDEGEPLYVTSGSFTAPKISHTFTLENSEYAFEAGDYTMTTGTIVSNELTYTPPSESIDPEEEEEPEGE
jgi:hypothetical protein